MRGQKIYTFWSGVEWGRVEGVLGYWGKDWGVLRGVGESGWRGRLGEQNRKCKHETGIRNNKVLHHYQ